MFVLLADDLSPGLATIVSRCVRVPFAAVAARGGRGVAGGPGRGRRRWPRSVAAASGGNLDRARLLADDPGFTDRRSRWRSVPGRLDGTGAAAVSVADELLGLADGALAPLAGRSTPRELAALEEQAEATGARGVPGRQAVEDRHKREERRWRTDDLRMGLAALADAYRDRMVATRALGGRRPVRRGWASSAGGPPPTSRRSTGRPPRPRAQRPGGSAARVAAWSSCRACSNERRPAGVG